jgi:5'-methylthioadenosine phosphorylase
MTNLQEARLAREAELCYGTLAMATDYDCWHGEHGDVSVEAILAVMSSNVQHARGVLRAALPRLATAPRCACQDALRYAILTDPARIPAEARERLGLFLDRYLT